MRVKEANVKSTSMGEPNLRFRNQLSFSACYFPASFLLGMRLSPHRAVSEGTTCRVPRFLNSCITFFKNRGLNIFAKNNHFVL